MNNLKKKIVAMTIGLSMVVMMAPGLAQALTADELQTQINTLMAQLATLQTQLATLQGTTTPTVTGCTVTSFDRNLKQGMTGNDVKCLQIVLNSDSATQVAATGVGSSGNETTYFGALTKAAVVKFQEKYAADCLTPLGLTAGTGFVGTKTLAKLNAILTAGVVTPPTGCTTAADCLAGYTCTAGACVQIPVAAGLTVALSAVTPAAAVLVSGSAYNVFTKVNLTAGSASSVNLTGVVVTRTGYSNDNYVDGVMVKDSSGKRHGNVVTLSESKATIAFTSDPITIAAGTTDYITVQVNLNSANAVSGTMAMGIASAVGITSNASAVNGTFPITGNLMSLTAGTTIIGAISVDAVTISAAEREIALGVTDQPIGKFKFTETSSQENVKINKITLYNNGTMADGDVANIDLVSPTGSVLATVSQTTGKYVIFDLTNSPWTVDKGTSDIFTVRADTVVGSGRTCQFIAQNDYDTEAIGVDTGAGILVGVTGNTVDAAFPIGDTANLNAIKLAAGTLTASKDSSSPAGEISAGATDVVLGTWKLQAAGEDIELRQIDLELTGGTGASATCATAATCDLTGTVKVKDAATGTTIYSVSASTAAIWNGTANVVSLASYMTIPANSSKLVKVVADISSTNAATGDTFVARLGNFYYKRVSTNTFGTASLAAWIDANALPVSTASLTVAKNTAYSGGNLIAGAPGLKIGSYILQAGSADGVNVNTINVTLSANTGLSNLTLKKGTTQLGSIIASPVQTTDTNSFSVSGQLDIAASGSATVDVYVDTATTATASSPLVTFLPASGIGATAASSGASLTGIPVGVITGQPIVLGVSGTLTVALNSTTTASKAIFHAGEAGIALVDIKFAAGTFENIKISKVILVARNGSANLSNLTLWDGATQVGTAADMISGIANFSGLSVTVSKGTSKTLTVKADTNTTGVVKSQLELQVAAFYAETVGADSGAIIRPAISNSEVKLAAGAFVNTYQPGDVGIIVDSGTASAVAMNTATSAGLGTTPAFTYQGTTVTEAASDSISLLPISSYETAGTSGAVVYDYTAGEPVVINDGGVIDVGVVATAGGVGSVPKFSYAAVNNTALTATVDKVAKIAGMVQTVTVPSLVYSFPTFSVGDVVVYVVPGTSSELAMYTAAGVFTGVSTGAITEAISDVATELQTYGTAVAGAGGAVTTINFTAGDPVVINDGGVVFAGVCSTSTVAATNIAKFQWGANNDIVLTATDRVTKLYGQAARGEVMIVEDVEPTVSLATGSPSGTLSPSSNQEIARFDIKADGQVDLNLTSLAMKKSGSNYPYSFVKDFKLYKGTTLLAEVSGVNANTRTLWVSGAATAVDVASTAGFYVGDTILYIDASTEANSGATTISSVTDYNTFVTAADVITAGNAADYFYKYSVTDADTVVAGGTTYDVANTNLYSVGDYLYVISVTDAADSGGAVVASVGATTITVTQQALTGICDNAAAVADGESARIYNLTRGSNSVVFNSVSPTQTLTAQTITAGTTLTLKVVADTSSVKKGITTGTATFGVTIEGTAAGAGDVVWDYTPLGGSLISNLNISDSYSVAANTLSY